MRAGQWCGWPYGGGSATKFMPSDPQRTDRRARLKEPHAAARPGGGVLRLARRRSERPAEPGGGFQYPDGTHWGRPVASVVGPDGALYVSDDYADAVYRLAPPS
ncbi:hypothetical protein MCHIJ_07810 [Mycolicibacterium chitae]|nr:hypothetical protein MCHIJ_07810 [Mycolicibacterium chitae]